MTDNLEQSMAYVAGVDLNMTRVAIAVITRRAGGSIIATASSFASRAPRGEERVADLAGCVDRAVCAARLVVIAPAEEPSAGALRRAVLAALARRGVQVVTVAPAEHTTDVVALWPAVNLANAGEVAALQLAHHTAVCQGWVLPRGMTPSEMEIGSAREVDFALYGSRGSRTADRDPAKSTPRIAEADRPDPVELERQHQLATKRRVQPRVWR